MFWIDLYSLNLLLSLAGLLLLLITIGLYVDYFLFQSECYIRWVKRIVWLLVLLTTIGATLVALLYSEYFGFVPCSLCWLQRIALFPQVLMALIAFKLKDKTYFPLYAIGLSTVGFGVSVYHYVYQLIPQHATNGMVLPCLADGTGDCAVKVINQFGFVTFPFLTAVVFAFLVILYLHLKRCDHVIADRYSS